MSAASPYQMTADQFFPINRPVILTVSKKAYENAATTGPVLKP